MYKFYGWAWLLIHYLLLHSELNVPILIWINLLEVKSSKQLPSVLSGKFSTKSWFFCWCLFKALPNHGTATQPATMVAIASQSLMNHSIGLSPTKTTLPTRPSTLNKMLRHPSLFFTLWCSKPMFSCKSLTKLVQRTWRVECVAYSVICLPISTSFLSQSWKLSYKSWLFNTVVCTLDAHLLTLTKALLASVLLHSHLFGV